MPDPTGPLSESNFRVRDAAAAMGLEIDIRVSSAPTRTAAEAAEQCRCDIAQIVKSLIFRGERTGEALLLLVSGANRVDQALVAVEIEESLMRPDARYVRDVTGFSIGGIPPFGHSMPMRTLMDRDLMQFEVIYAAAGTPNSIFAISPGSLAAATGATIIAMQG